MQRIKCLAQGHNCGHSASGESQTRDPCPVGAVYQTILDIDHVMFDSLICFDAEVHADRRTWVFVDVYGMATRGRAMSIRVKEIRVILLVHVIHMQLLDIARPLGLHYNHYATVRPWSVSENMLITFEPRGIF